MRLLSSLFALCLASAGFAAGPDFARDVLPILTAMIGGIVRPVEQTAAPMPVDVAVPAQRATAGATQSEVRS